MNERVDPDEHEKSPATQDHAKSGHKDRYGGFDPKASFVTEVSRGDYRRL